MYFKTCKLFRIIYCLSKFMLKVQVVWSTVIYCLSVCVCKPFIFSSSPKSLGQFQANLAQIILGLRSFDVKMKDHAHIQGKIIAKRHWLHMKISRNIGNYSAQHPLVKWLSINMLVYSYLCSSLGNVFQVSNMAHRPLVVVWKVVYLLQTYINLLSLKKILFQGWKYV